MQSTCSSKSFQNVALVVHTFAVKFTVVRRYQHQGFKNNLSFCLIRHMHWSNISEKKVSVAMWHKLIFVSKQSLDRTFIGMFSFFGLPLNASSFIHLSKASCWNDEDFWSCVAVLHSILAVLVLTLELEIRLTLYPLPSYCYICMALLHVMVVSDPTWNCTPSMG